MKKMKPLFLEVMIDIWEKNCAGKSLRLHITKIQFAYIIKQSSSQYVKKIISEKKKNFFSCPLIIQKIVFGKQPLNRKTRESFITVFPFLLWD